MSSVTAILSGGPHAGMHIEVPRGLEPLKLYYEQGGMPPGEPPRIAVYRRERSQWTGEPLDRSYWLDRYERMA